MEDFIKSESISVKDESDIFEQFSSFCVVSQQYDEKFELEDIMTSGGNDAGIDSLAVIIGGTLINSKEELEDVLKYTKHLSNIKLIFIQAKTSPKFDGSEILNFGHGVKDIMSEKTRRKLNESIKQKKRLIDYIYSQRLKDKPQVFLYYVTTGKWLNDKNCLANIEDIKCELEKMNIFDKVDFQPVDADMLRKYYDSVINASQIEIELLESNRIPLPQINKVEQSFLGLVGFNEFIKLIADENGNIIKNVFFSNVRDFQGDNPVNDEIGNTICKDAENFVLFNNGVTIICREIIFKRNNTLILNDYEIVNGCQTSHIIFNYKSNPNVKKLIVPIKIIVTRDEELINKVIKATNNQTPISDTELLALSDFTKKLETFYFAYDKDDPLYYERRNKQYNLQSGIDNAKIISMKEQIKAFASMFCDIPYLASRFYKKILDSSPIFRDDHQLLPYYTSARILYEFNNLIRNNKIKMDYKKYRYFIIGLLRHRLSDGNNIRLTSKKINEECEVILSVAKDKKEFLKHIKAICAVIKKEVKDLNNTEKTKSKDLYTKLTEKVCK